MDLNTFPNPSKQPAIVLTSTHLRGLPTEASSFSSISSDGSGYPFDNRQFSYLTTNRQWCLVLTRSCTYGCVKRKDIAYVDQQFMQAWRTACILESITEKEVKPFKETWMGEQGSRRTP